MSRPRNFTQLSKDGYEANVTVYVCINEIAKAIAGLQWLLFRRRGGREDEIEVHPLLDLLARPNPWEGQGKFFEKMVGYLMLSGNSYIEAVTPGSGPASLLRPPRELYTLRPDRMTVLPHPINRIAGYRYEAGGEKTEFDAPQVLHVKLFHPTDDWYGLSPISVAATVVDSDNASLTWNYSLLKNSARQSGAFVIQKNLTDVQFDRLKAQVQDDHVGPTRAGSWMVLEGGADWKEMSLSPKDMDWLQGRKDSRLEIAMLFQVQPELIGLKEGTFENRREARLAFYSETILPLADMLRDDLNNWLTPRYGDDLHLDYDRDAISALQEDRQKVWERIKGSTWLTENEKRQATGYDQDPRFDVWLVPAALLPFDVETGAGFGELGGNDERGRRMKKEHAEGGPTELPPDPARERLWKGFVRQFLPIELRYKAALRRYFRSQEEEVLTQLQAHASILDTRASAHDYDVKQVIELLFNLDDETEKLQRVSRPFFEEGLKRGGDAVWLEVGAAGAFGGDAPRSRGKLKVQLDQVGRIVESAKRRVSRAIEAGLNNPEGAESVQQIATRIRDVYRSLDAAQAQTIARTETAKAYNEGRDAAMDDLQIDETEWRSARDEAVRVGHLIDGERRVRGEAFTNGLRYPHDPNGEPGMVINCRCVALPAQRRR